MYTFHAESIHYIVNPNITVKLEYVARGLISSVVNTVLSRTLLQVQSQERYHCIPLESASKVYGDMAIHCTYALGSTKKAIESKSKLKTKPQKVGIHISSGYKIDYGKDMN